MEYAETAEEGGYEKVWFFCTCWRSRVSSLRRPGPVHGRRSLPARRLGRPSSGGPDRRQGPDGPRAGRDPALEADAPAGRRSSATRCGRTPSGVRGGFWEGWKYEIAAYVLDKLLGLGMVPPTVEKAMAGRPGSCQLWIEGTERYGDMLAARKGMDGFRSERLGQGRLPGPALRRPRRQRGPARPERPGDGRFPGRPHRPFAGLPDDQKLRRGHPVLREERPGREPDAASCRGRLFERTRDLTEGQFREALGDPAHGRGDPGRSRPAGAPPHRGPADRSSGSARRTSSTDRAGR
ncbi:MAG: hypothetical protein MZU95_01865 [Desulfomicrobium escambiense]|nr:hypothetical protein [Desulfomicrobium escambiense]